MKNLIMGSASGYDWNMLEPFVMSFVRNCPSAELVLFVNDISDFTRDRLISCGRVKLEPFKVINNPVNDRWNNFLSYIEVHGNDYEQVFITDTRDVIFQDDVFSAFKGKINWLGYSTEFLCIGQETNHNYRWMKVCFGKKELEKLADKRIICAGSAAIGSTEEVKIFLEKMVSTNPKTYLVGSDQATMNYLIHNNLLPIENLIELDTYSGAIYTNGIIQENNFLGDKILRGDGGVPAVVHQYDRHAPQVQLVDNVYRDKNFQADERFTDSRSVLEQIFHLLYADKADDAARFCMKIFSAEFNRGENVDHLLRVWEIVLQRPLTPAVGFIELTIQSALKFAKGMSFNQLNKICELLIHSAKNSRGVEHGFKDFVIKFLLNVVGQTIDAGNAEICFHFIGVIKSFELPPDRDFYLLQARANRIFGRKEEALAAYKKALDLS